MATSPLLSPPDRGNPPPFTELVDLASERVGGAALLASDEFFAGKENLLKRTDAVFLVDEYTDRGKWMDGWESRRSFGRVPGHTHDWCIVKLGLPGTIEGLDVDTSFFRGNFPEACAVDACEVDGDPEASALLDAGVAWSEILPRTPLSGHASNYLALPRRTKRVTHLRLRIFPDGGVARLRVYGHVLPNWKRILHLGTAIDLAAVESGGVVVACNDMFFGSRHNLIMPGRSVNMGDGWETKRKRREGHDWVIVQLGTRGTVRSVEVDTNHFKGNFPESCWLEGADAAGASVEQLVDPKQTWVPLLPRTKLRAHTRHFYLDELTAGKTPFTHVRLSIHPDGGISRLRLFGDPSGDPR